ncbi:MAG TPA: PAS domain S-box protein, partial [Dehalococcoidia bacterium]|nr:PAS domain S-box protein [Dehalococcoidia bacterium]
MDERSTTIADYTDYRAIFRASGDGLIVNDLDTGLVVEANPAACEMHGYTREEFLRLHPTQFIDPAFHDLFRDYIAALRRGEELRAVARDLRKDGSSFPVEVHGSRFLF